MVPIERVVLQFFILILCIINGLHSYPRHRPSLGILNELIGQDSKSPLIVVVDSNNQARTLDGDQELRQEQKKGRHVHNPRHHSDKFSEREYEKALYELLRTSERLLEEEYARSRSSNKKNIKNIKNKGKKDDNCAVTENAKGKKKKDDSCAVTEEAKGKKKKKDSCENVTVELLAEQCSKSERSCDESNNC